MTQIDVALEIKRRQKEVYKRSLYFLCLIIWTVHFYRLSRCPACNYLLRNLFGYPMLWKSCPKCHTSFTSSG